MSRPLRKISEGISPRPGPSSLASSRRWPRPPSIESCRSPVRAATNPRAPPRPRRRPRCRDAICDDGGRRRRRPGTEPRRDLPAGDADDQAGRGRDPDPRGGHAPSARLPAIEPRLSGVREGDHARRLIDLLELSQDLRLLGGQSLRRKGGFCGFDAERPRVVQPAAQLDRAVGADSQRSRWRGRSPVMTASMSAASARCPWRNTESMSRTTHPPVGPGRRRSREQPAQSPDRPEQMHTNGRFVEARHRADFARRSALE